MARAAKNRGSELSAALAACRKAFIGVALFSALLNILYLTGSFYMLEVYDRVLPSRSVPTLVGITLLALVLFGFQGVLDIIRSRLLVRVGSSLDGAVSERVHHVLMKLPLKGAASQGLQPLRDLDQVRSFLSTVGPAALFDLPWMPLYLAICYLFHPLIGIVATAGGLILVVVALLTEVMTRKPSAEAAFHAGGRNSLAEANRRNTEAVHAMGMAGRLGALWSDCNQNYMAAQQRAADIAAGFGGLSKVLRMALQSGVLGVGAWLVINQQATAGIIIASSILTSRALAPIELAISQWRGFVAARQSWRRLNILLDKIPAEPTRLALPKPVHSLAVEAVSVAPPGTNGSSSRTWRFTSRPDRVSGSSGRARPASRRWRASSWAYGRPFAAGSASMARHSISGRRKRSGRISATCRRTWSCSPARWRKTLRASSRFRSAAAIIAAATPPACTS